MDPNQHTFTHQLEHSLPSQPTNQLATPTDWNAHFDGYSSLPIGLSRPESSGGLHPGSVPINSPLLATHQASAAGPDTFSPSYFHQLAQSFPAQPAADWSHQFNPRSYTEPHNPLSYLPFGPSSMPNTPAVGFNPDFNQPSNSTFGLKPASVSNNDHSIGAFHHSFDPTSSGGQGAGASHSRTASTPGAFSSGPLSPPLPGSKAIDKLNRNNKPTPKRSSSFVKAARGAASAGVQQQANPSRPLHIRQSTHPGPQPSPLGSPLASPRLASAAVAGFPGLTASHQRPLPPLPRSRQSTAPTPSPLISQASSPVAGPSTGASANPFGHYASPSAALQYAQSPSSAHPTPPASQPQSPFPSTLDYGFASIETDLDRFSSGGFASAAAAAMASVGPNRPKPSTGQQAFGLGSYGSPTPTAYTDHASSSPTVLGDVLADGASHSVPVGSPLADSPHNVFDFNQLYLQSPMPGAASSLGPDQFASLDNAVASASARESPQGSASPSGSTIVDEESVEALTKKDPIAAQVWRMFNKAKGTLPNGTKVENLTWRLMSMTLKKRREESVAAEQQAEIDAFEALLAQSQAEVAAEEAEAAAINSEEADDVHELRRTTTNASARAASAVSTLPEEEPERGRRRRTATGATNADKSASASPETFADDDGMDWRAKSQSRSRSRAPDLMDWRGASRSRSRAPDLRVTAIPPTVDSTAATANFARFSYGHTGALGSMGPPSRNRNDTGARTIAEVQAALAMSQAEEQRKADAAAVTAAAVAAGAPGGPAFTFNNGSDAGKTGPDPNLAAIESTLNQLISLQSLATSPTPSGAAHSPAPHRGSLSINNPLSLATSPSAVASPYSVGSPSVISPFGPSSPSLNGHTSVGGSLSNSFHDGSFANALHERAATHDSHFSYPTVAQQLASSRAGGQPLAASSSAPKPVGMSSSPYINATTLAQSSRPFNFSPNASGITLGRPSTIHEGSHSVPPTPSVDNTPQHSFLSQSASSTPGPGWGHVGSLTSNFDEQDSNQLLLDYFQSQNMAAQYGSPYHQANGFDLSGGATHINPSDLIANHHQPHNPSGYDSESVSSWGVSPRGGLDSPKPNTPSPPDGKPAPSHQRSLPLLSAAQLAATAAANSAALKANPSEARRKGAAGAGAKAKAHVRSATLPSALPATIPEEVKPAKADAGASAGAANLVADAAAATAPAAGESTGPRCLNCSTVNTPLWRRDAEGRPLCNACGLFKQLHGVDRPASLNTGVVKKRNRARGPKDAGGKKVAAPRAAGGAGRRGSASAAAGAAGGGEVAGGAGASRTGGGGGGARAGGAPYPSQAARAEHK